MRRLLATLVRGYQLAISPLLPPLCRFEPSCSEYTRQALLRHGAVKGTLLGIWRILRCNPLCKAGLYDPVPPVGRWKS